MVLHRRLVLLAYFVSYRSKKFFRFGVLTKLSSSTLIKYLIFEQLSTTNFKASTCLYERFSYDETFPKRILKGGDSGSLKSVKTNGHLLIIHACVRSTFLLICEKKHE
nr:unnamed protein product [Callosobruchus chinensis]